MHRNLRKGVGTLALTAVAVLLSGCTAEVRHEWRNFALPDPGTEEAQGKFSLEGTLPMAPTPAPA